MNAASSVADAPGRGGVAGEHADRRLARADRDRRAAAQPELGDERGRAGGRARAAQSGTITVAPSRRTHRGHRLVAELLPDPPGGRAAAAQRRHDERPAVAAPLRDADEVQGELAGDGVGRLAHQHLERHAAEREPAEPRRRALLARRARELRDVLREAVDALDGAALAAHGHAAPAQDAPAAVGQQRRRS